LGWVSIDTPIRVMSLLGLAFLLLLAGREVDYERFRGRRIRLRLFGYAISFGLAVLIGLGLHESGLVKSTLLIGIALSATSLGIVIPVLKDAGEVRTPFGQLVVASASIAEIATIALLSLFISEKAGGVGAKLVRLSLFVLFVIAVGLAVLAPEQSTRISAALLRLQDTTTECGSARRSPCLPSLSSLPSASAWKRFSAPSSPVRSSSWSIATRR
jgi:Kef-type K+ transport system membrane component KefB